jgi:hypothetical protein
MSTSLLYDYITAFGVSVSWKHKTGNNGEDDTYATSTITVLWAHGAKVVRTTQGDELQCQAIVKCEAAVEAGDVLTKDGRDYPVLGLVGVSFDGSMRSVALGGSRSGGA